MKVFKNHLKSQHYKIRTINEHCLNVERFIKWFGSTDQQELAQLSVAKLVEYINVLQAKELAAETINLQLRSIRKYYQYLESEGCIIPKIENVKVKGITKKVIIDPLEYSDLEQLYKDYSAYKKQQIEKLKEARLIKASKTCSGTALKRKVMLGFMVFQGLHSGELKRLEINHINNEDVTVFIMGSGKSKARELKLQPL
ncbi:MAG: hypothetical protein GQ574_25820 [Crocinitomix sp.]|nr:hypothetical protein [Crocinitomix sp.]